MLSALMVNTLIQTGRRLQERQFVPFREDGLCARLRPLTRKQIMQMSGKNHEHNFHEFDRDAYAKAVEIIESGPDKFKYHGNSQA